MFYAIFDESSIVNIYEILRRYNGSVVKTKIKDFYNEPICMVVGG